MKFFRLALIHAFAPNPLVAAHTVSGEDSPTSRVFGAKNATVPKFRDRTATRRPTVD